MAILRLVKPQRPLFLTSPQACGSTSPPKSAAIASIVMIVAALTTVEQLARWGLYQWKSAHYLLEKAQHRNVIARCVFVDALSCLVCVYLGFTNLKVLWNDKRTAISYHPHAYFLCLFFLSYQIKDMYDLYLWGDQMIYIVHHIITIEAAWSALYPGYAQHYAIFYCGIGELSTLPLSLLPIFDNEKGVEGLETMFPQTKLAIGLVFCTLFLLCRCTLWPVCSYYFVKDAIGHLRQQESGSASLKAIRFWIIEKIVANCVLSALQLCFVVVIIATLWEEFKQ